MCPCLSDLCPGADEIANTPRRAGDLQMIRRGEVVIVIKPMPCCGSGSEIGYVFVVQGVMPR